MSDFHVYSIWSGTTPLYVGQTSDLNQRLRTHASSSRWYREVTHISIIGCASRDEALHVEMERIVKLRPLHNVQGNPRWRLVADYIAWDEWERREPTARERKAQARGTLLAQAAPPLTAEQVENAARVLASVEIGDAA